MRNSVTNPNGDCHSYSHCDRDGYCNGYAYTDSYGNCNSYCHSHSYRYTYDYSCCHANCYSYADRHSPTNADAQISTNAEKSSHSAAAALRSVCCSWDRGSRPWKQRSIAKFRLAGVTAAAYRRCSRITPTCRGYSMTSLKVDLSILLPNIRGIFLDKIAVLE